MLHKKKLIGIFWNTIQKSVCDHFVKMTIFNWIPNGSKKLKLFFVSSVLNMICGRWFL